MSINCDLKDCEQPAAFECSCINYPRYCTVHADAHKKDCPSLQQTLEQSLLIYNQNLIQLRELDKNLIDLSKLLQVNLDDIHSSFNLNLRAQQDFLRISSKNISERKSIELTAENFHTLKIGARSQSSVTYYINEMLNLKPDEKKFTPSSRNTQKYFQEQGESRSPEEILKEQQKYEKYLEEKKRGDEVKGQLEEARQRKKLEKKKIEAEKKALLAKKLKEIERIKSQIFESAKDIEYEQHETAAKAQEAEKAIAEAEREKYEKKKLLENVEKEKKNAEIALMEVEKEKKILEELRKAEEENVKRKKELELKAELEKKEADKIIAIEEEKRHKLINEKIKIEAEKEKVLDQSRKDDEETAELIKKIDKSKEVAMEMMLAAAEAKKKEKQAENSLKDIKQQAELLAKQNASLSNEDLKKFKKVEEDKEPQILIEKSKKRKRTQSLKAKIKLLKNKGIKFDNQERVEILKLSNDGYYAITCKLYLGKL